jgi:hypothetical protein
MKALAHSTSCPVCGRHAARVEVVISRIHWLRQQEHVYACATSSRLMGHLECDLQHARWMAEEAKAIAILRLSSWANIRSVARRPETRLRQRTEIAVRAWGNSDLAPSSWSAAVLLPDLGSVARHLKSEGVSHVFGALREMVHGRQVILTQTIPLLACALPASTTEGVQ